MADDVFRFVKGLCLFSIELKGKKKYLKRQKKKIFKWSRDRIFRQMQLLKIVFIKIRVYFGDLK